MRYWITLAGLALVSAGVATAGGDEEQPLRRDGELLSPSEFLTLPQEDTAKVFLLGTWHFAYPGQDAHKVDDSERVDVLTDKRQAEIGEALDYLERFRPDAIALECRAGSGIVEDYAGFRRDELEPRRNERYQLGFRLAERAGLDTVHCVRADSVYDDHTEALKEMGLLHEEYDFRSDDPLSRRYNRWSSYKDRVAKEATILEALRYTNRDDVLDAGFGAYLVGDFKLGEHAGADALALYWYNRNLRLFRKIQMIADAGKRRIMVIYGSGHMQILKELVDSSPEFERVPFDALADS